MTRQELTAALNPAIEIQAAHLASIREFEARGFCRYSNEDCDVYGAAFGALRRTEVASYERRWVDRMLHAPAALAA